MPLRFKNELDFKSFKDFARANAKYAYMQALTATHDDRKSEKLAAKALFSVLKNKKHFEAEPNNVDENTAIDLSLRSLLSGKEKKMLDNAPTANEVLDQFLADDDNTAEHFKIYPPSEESERRIISKACAKAESITPRYAPLYTGTKSGIILIIVLAFICAAIFFIWKDPADIISDKSTQYDNHGSIISVPTSGSLIDIEFVPEQSAQGIVPVRIYISGPDRGLVSSVTYSPDNSSSVASAYQCGDEYWVMMASSNNYYKVNIKGSNALDVVKHFRVSTAIPSAPVVSVIDVLGSDNANTYTVSVKTSDGSSHISSSDIAEVKTDENGNYRIAVPTGLEYTFFFADDSGNCTSLLITSGGRPIVSPSLASKEFALGHDSSKTINLSEMLPDDRTYSISASTESENISAYVDSDNILTLTASNGFVGIDSIDITIADSYGLSTSTSIPVIVSNSAPYYEDPSQLYSTLVHTPNNAGHLFGTLSATDAQNDYLTYTLVNQTDCNVVLAPGGSFMLFIDPEYKGHSASFDFTVSDGILTCDPYRYTISLQNNIIEPDNFKQEFVCYSGENGWYLIDLPIVDPDGDILSWNVTTELTEDSRTPEGNYISFADGLSRVIIRANPERNEEFSETLTLTCSDGWLSSDIITVECFFIKNEPPVPGEENRAKISVFERSGTFTLDIIDDCEFDTCAIKEVISCTGGEVVENIGWNTLNFTVNFTPVIDEPEPVHVVLLVEDTVTKETVEIDYTIKRFAQ